MKIKYVLISIKKNLSIPLIFIVMLLGQTMFSGHANAAIPLASFDFKGDTGTRAISDQIRFTVSFGWFPESSYSERSVVFDLILSTADVGQTYTVSSGPEFDEAIVSLTNGINEYIYCDTRGSQLQGPPGGGWGSLESLIFFGDATGANGIDFAGYDINSISVTINTLTFDTPGSNPNGDGLWTDIEFNATIAVTKVPVATTAWFFGSGLIGLIGIFKRKKMV